MGGLGHIQGRGGEQASLMGVLVDRLVGLGVVG